jgi:hypothetical protein
MRATGPECCASFEGSDVSIAPQTPPPEIWRSGEEVRKAGVAGDHDQGTLGKGVRSGGADQIGKTCRSIAGLQATRAIGGDAVCDLEFGGDVQQLDLVSRWQRRT